MRAYESQGYAGGFACAVKRQGFDIVGKVEQDDSFGMPAWMHNRAWLAPNLEVAKASAAVDWPVLRDVSVVYGNPPCSAFSNLMADSKYVAAGVSGVEGRQNRCMYDLVDLGARNNATVVVFESVRNAGEAGLPLMLELHNRLEENTGKTYHLTMVFLNALSVGGSQNRARFFWIASRLGPVAMPLPTGRAKPLGATLEDLQLLEDDDPRSIHSSSRTPRILRLKQLAEYGWAQGEHADAAYDRAVAAGMQPWTVGRSDMIRNPHTARRWRWNVPSWVVTGGTFNDGFHPIRNRGFTHAELGRLMGFPQEYDLRGIVNAGSKGQAYYGKATPVESAEYVMRGIRSHLLNIDEPIIPTLYQGDRRWIVDVTDAWTRRSNDPALFEEVPA